MATPNDQVIRYAILKALRKVYQNYSLARKEVIKDATVKISRINLDGSTSLRYNVFRKCSICGVLCRDTERDVDHIDPVGEMPSWPFENGALEAWIRRLFCKKENLRVLCKPCHKQITKEGRKK